MTETEKQDMAKAVVAYHMAKAGCRKCRAQMEAGKARCSYCNLVFREEETA